MEVTPQGNNWPIGFILAFLLAIGLVILFLVPQSAPQVEVPAPAAGAGDASTASAPQACVWQRYTETLPELSAELTAALSPPDGVQASITAFSFGENCLGEENQVVNSEVMQTDFDLLILAEDTEAVAGLIPVLRTVSKDDTPGPLPGRITVTVQNSAGERLLRLIFWQYDLLEALDQGLQGDDLIDALQGT
jgi:hypothetical protein